LGSEVAAADPDLPPTGLDASGADLADLFDGPVITRGATCVYQGPPVELRRQSDLFPGRAAALRVAFTTLPGPPSDTDLECLHWFDEVWVSSTLDRERLGGAGVQRHNLQVILPGIAIAAGGIVSRPARSGWRCVTFLDPADLEGAAMLLEAWLGVFQRSDSVELLLLVPTPERPEVFRPRLIRTLAHRVDWFDPELPRVSLRPAPEPNADRMELWRSANLLIAVEPGAPHPVDCLEAMIARVPLLAAGSAGLPDFIHEGTAYIAAASVGDLRDALWRTRQAPESLVPFATRAADLVPKAHSLEIAAQHIVARHSKPYRPDPAVLARVLLALGLKSPDDLLQGSRSKVFLCLFPAGEDSWREPLRRFLNTYTSRDDVTLCLWADAETADGLGDLASQITAETQASASPDGAADLQLLIAPADHVPWHRVVVDPLFEPRSPAKMAAP
jgi:hypothetical protein